LKTKYVIIVPDGAADDPLDIFDGKTVLEAAQTPNMDRVSTEGRQGIAWTVPEDMSPGSDVAQMSLLGYDPREYYTGRAPIEAAAMGIDLGPDDWVFRCNLVTFSDDKMADHSAGHIASNQAGELIEQIAECIDDDDIRFYPGVSYRNLCVIKNKKFKLTTHPPHDIIGKKISKNLPRGKNSNILLEIMAKSQRAFEHHEINRVRADLGENPVSSLWFWGQGQKASLESFQQLHGINGAAITAVDLVRGLAKLIGFDLINVPGATGYLDTNYAGKGEAAIKALDNYDLVFVHIEAPDEAGHGGSAQQKKTAIEQIDKLIVGPVFDAIQKYESWRILVMPDHPTPVTSRAHSSEPVPFAMAGTGINGIINKPFNEQNSELSGFKVLEGHEMMEYFLKIQ